ncbi:MAG: delta-60 repeat domain-containing protein, partial [Blastocatellia bacterium]
YNPDGSLDQGFGSGGKQTADFFGNADEASAIVIQTDGKIVAAGSAQHTGDSASSDFALARYNTDGSLDQGFGAGGKLTTDFFANLDSANAVAIQPDGKIVLVGIVYHSSTGAAADFGLARYNPDGSLDQGFGAGGKLATDFFGNSDNATGVAIQPDGKVVVAGDAHRSDASTTGDFALARYNPDGSLDQNFGAGGKQTTVFFGNGDAAVAVAIQTDGRILVAGLALLGASASTLNFALARYNQDGSLDQSFGSGGKQTTDFFGNRDFPSGLAIQPDGAIVVAGIARHSDDDSTDDFALARYSSGVPVPDFTISLNPQSVTTNAGTKITATVAINRTGGFAGNVTVTPPASAMGIKPKPAAPMITAGPSVVFKMKVGAGVAPGSYDRTFTATDGSGKTRTATLTIVVQKTR